MSATSAVRRLGSTRLKLSKTLWGVPEAGWVTYDTRQWDALFARIKAEGFDGIEAIRPFYTFDPAALNELLEKHQLELLCQIHTTGGRFDEHGEFVYCSSNKLGDHVASFEELCSEAAELNPAIINSHSGHDSWGSDERAVSFLQCAIQVEEALNLPIVHETHRQRLFFSPYSSLPLLQHPLLKSKVKLNADLSHWCCVCEKVFDASDPRDDWWPEVLAEVAEACHLIHCRIGHAEGPQVNHPDAPEHAADVQAHIGWWQQIWKAQAARGLEEVWAEPEFGPAPYMPSLPFTSQPVSDLWAVNKRVAEMIEENFALCEQ